MLIDPFFRRFLLSTGPNPTQISLDHALKNASRVLVSAQRFNFEPELGAHPLIDERNTASINDLRNALKINESGKFGHCMCYGDLGIEFLRGSRSLLTLVLHHGQSIRCALWKWDAHLLECNTVLDWLAAHGVVHPKNDYLDAQQRAQQSQHAWEQWLSDTPPLLAAHPDLLRGNWAIFDWQQLGPIVEQTWPHPIKRAQGLFAWFGKGHGPWSGFPGYEMVPEHFLAEMEEVLLVEALQQDSLTPETWFGAARFFSHWDIKTDRSKNLPLSLKHNLLQAAHNYCSPEHAEDIVRRAVRAYR